MSNGLRRGSWLFLVVALVALLIVWLYARRVKNDLDQPERVAGARASSSCARTASSSCASSARSPSSSSRARRACACRSSTGR